MSTYSQAKNSSKETISDDDPRMVQARTADAIEAVAQGIRDGKYETIEDGFASILGQLIGTCIEHPIVLGLRECTGFTVCQSSTTERWLWIVRGVNLEGERVKTYAEGETAVFGLVTLVYECFRAPETIAWKSDPLQQSSSGMGSLLTLLKSDG